MNRKASSFIYFLILICSSGANAQVQFGIKYGIQKPGKQDLKFKIYDENGLLIQNIKTTNVYSNTTSITSAHVTFWRNKFGLSLDYHEWEHFSTATQYQTKQIPEINQTEQARQSYMFNVLFRNGIADRLLVFKNIDTHYGIGFGAVNTEIDHGLTNDVRLGFQARYGVRLTLSNSVAILLESKYMLTHDADNLNGPPETLVIDTSGRWTLFRFGPHLDTRYYTLQIGVEWAIN